MCNDEIACVNNKSPAGGWWLVASARHSKLGGTKWSRSHITGANTQLKRFQKPLRLGLSATELSGEVEVSLLAPLCGIKARRHFLRKLLPFRKLAPVTKPRSVSDWGENKAEWQTQLIAAALAPLRLSTWMLIIAGSLMYEMETAHLVFWLSTKARRLFSRSSLSTDSFRRVWLVVSSL